MDPVTSQQIASAREFLHSKMLCDMPQSDQLFTHKFDDIAKLMAEYSNQIIAQQKIIAIQSHQAIDN